MSAILPVRTVAPAATPVSVAEAKAHLNIEAADTDFDTLITALIEAATAHFDGRAGILGRALVTQTWQQDLWDFPAGRHLCLPLGPAIAISSIAYYDADNAAQTLSGDVYAGPFEGTRTPFAWLNDGQAWPATYWRPDAVRVTWTAGFGAATAVPQPIRQAIKLLVGHWFEHREGVITGTIATDLQFTMDALTAPYRRVGV